MNLLEPLLIKLQDSHISDFVIILVFYLENKPPKGIKSALRNELILVYFGPKRPFQNTYSFKHWFFLVHAITMGQSLNLAMFYDILICLPCPSPGQFLQTGPTEQWPQSTVHGLEEEKQLKMSGQLCLLLDMNDQPRY